MAVVYLFIILAIRLFGKKEIAQLSVIDLVFILLISNSVQNAMVGPSTSLGGGLVAGQESVDLICSTRRARDLRIESNVPALA